MLSILATVPRLFFEALTCSLTAVFVFFFAGFFFAIRFTKGTSSSSSSELLSEDEETFKRLAPDILVIKLNNYCIISGQPAESAAYLWVIWL